MKGFGMRKRSKEEEDAYWALIEMWYRMRDIADNAFR